MKIKKNDKLDYEEVNKSVHLLNQILKILFFVLIVVGIFVINYILKEWKILLICKTIFKILIPFFIGLFIAWLFNPAVTKLSKKMNRGLASIIVYTVFLLVITIFIIYCVPTMVSQLNEFVKVIPNLQKSASKIVDTFYDILSPYLSIDIDTAKLKMYDLIKNIASEMTSDLPSKIVSILTLFVSGFGTLLIGFVIGIYILIDFDGISKHIINIFPKKFQDDVKELIKIANTSLNNFIRGTLLISLIIAAFTYILFLLIGIKAPLLFALFCGITNIIPYIGPYIGGIPVSLVGFSQGMSSGIFTVIAVVLAQALDGYILQPILLGRGLKLHPVTIIIGLLIFGHFFGIIGMLLAMPIMSIVKLVYEYYDNKYDFFNRKSNDKNND